MEAAGIDLELASRQSDEGGHRSPGGGSESHGQVSTQAQAVRREYCSNATVGRPDLGPGRRRRIPGMRWSEQEILQAIRARLQEGKRMNPGAVGAEDDPLYRAAMRRYGSWRNALLVAGLNPRNCGAPLGASSVPGNHELRSDA